MSSHRCINLVVTCIDFRFQKFIDVWIEKNLGKLTHDRVSLAGGINDLFSILKQIEISSQLHNIAKVILINHEDCGAYGALGTPKKHREDLLFARTKIHVLYPQLDVELYYLHLGGTFEKISF